MSPRSAEAAVRNPGSGHKEFRVTYRLDIKMGAPIVSTSLYFKFETEIVNIYNYPITYEKLYSGA